MSSPEATPTDEFPTTPPPLPVAAPARVAMGKQPWAALLLSLLMPGLGQVYNGHVAKALTFFFGFCACIYLISEGQGLPFGIVLPFVYFWNMVDAYRSAELLNARGTVTPIEDEAESPAWGITLASIGLLLLLNNLGWLRLAALARYWPVLLIAAGLVLLRRSMQRKPVNGPIL